MSTSFSTTLFIPFNLKEKAEGDYLKKGFVIDDILNEYFPIRKDKYISFLKIGQFNNNIKTQALLRVLNPRLKNYKQENAINNIFNRESIVDKKYLNIIEGFYDLHTFSIQETNNEDYNLMTKLSNSFQIDSLEFESIEYGERFKLGEINLTFNRPFNNPGLAYGLVSVNLDWITQPEDINNLSKFTRVGPFLRYFDREASKNRRAKICVHRRFNNTRHQLVDAMVLNDLINFEENDTQNFSEYKLDDSIQALNFSLRSLVDELLRIFVNSDDLDKYLYFEKKEDNSSVNDDNEKIKPSFLHLIGTNSAITDIDFQKNIFDLLRLPEGSINLNTEPDFKPIKEDYKSLKYFLSEGAVVVESQTSPNIANKSIEKKYYMAFLFALNQRLLFHYFQKKINELEIESNGYFIPRELRRLKGTLLKGDFAQVFSSISNYHEIDSFYENLRKTFKIIQLREEFITSVESIEKIASLAEEKERRKKEERQKLFEERKFREKTAEEKKSKEREELSNKKQSDRLNNTILILTVVQVITALISPFSEAFETDKMVVYYINFIVFLLLTIALLVYIFIIIYNFLKFYFSKSGRLKNVKANAPVNPETVLVDGFPFVIGDNEISKLELSEIRNLSTKAQKEYLFRFSDEHSTKVKIKDFRIGIFTVTQLLWDNVMTNENITANNNLTNNDNEKRYLPKTDVSWDEVQLFIEKLNEKTRLNYRLPSEAEWEFAARGGKNSNHYLYAGSDDIYDVAWFMGNSFGKIVEVGQKIPNELGLYDMSGNVWEWCQDTYAEQHGEKVDGKRKVLKGGSCSNDMNLCRITNRHSKNQDEKDEFTGFRLVLDI